MLLSACLIVKNEALTLDRCLSSLRGVVDEIIVVDTGSTDDTIKIARDHGAMVTHFDWDGDFSHARNASLDLASGEYALVIDADEYLDEKQKEGLRTFLETNRPEALMIRQRNYLGQLSEIRSVLPLNVMRIFRSYHRYEGSIHEQISLSVERTKKPVAFFDLDFHHVGYLQDFMLQKGKTNRNRELLYQELENDPNNLFHLSNLMAEHLVVGELDEARRLGKRSLTILHATKKKPIFSSRIYSLYLLSLEDREEACTVYQEAIRLFPEHTDFRLRFAQYEIKQKRFLSAQNILFEAIKHGDPKYSMIEFTEGAGSFLSYTELARVYSFMEDAQSATESALRSFFMQPFDSKVMALLSYRVPQEGQAMLLERICDVKSAGEWAALQAIKGQNVEREIAEFENRFGKHVLFEFAKNVMSQGEKTFSKDTSEEEREWINGLCSIVRGEDGEAHLKRGGAKGAFLLQTLTFLNDGTEFHCGLKNIVWDLIGFRAYDLLKRILPHCDDLMDIWPMLYHTPFEAHLSDVLWSGDTPMEQAHLAHRAFYNRETEKGLTHIECAEKDGVTVYSRIVRADLLLQKGKGDEAKKTLLQAIEAFPQSRLLLDAKRALFGEIDHKQVFYALGGNQ